MRILFIIVFLVNIALALLSLAILPDTVAVHFGADGMADSWGSSVFNTAFMIGINTFLFVVIYFSTKLISVLPAGMVNIPNKEYWLTPEHFSEAQATADTYVCQLGAVILLFMFVVGCLALHANMSDPVRIHVAMLYGSLFALLVYVAIWAVAMFKAFRVPKEQPL